MSLPKFTVGETTIGQLVDSVAEQFPENMALEYHQLDIHHTYKGFKAVCDQVAKGFMALGIEKGEHVAIWANNVPEWLYVQFSTGKMGAVLVTVNTNYRSFELEYLLKQSDATTLIMVGGVRSDHEYLDIIYEVCPELKEVCPELKDSTRGSSNQTSYLFSNGSFSWERVVIPACLPGLKSLNLANRSVIRL